MSRILGSEIPQFEYGRRYYCYAMLCQDGDGPGYVKFGHSMRIGERLSQLRSSCPIPARYFAIIYVGSQLWMARKVEKALLQRFKPRQVSGEWRRFDFDSSDDKRDFNDGCREVFEEFLGEGHYWTKISVEALKEEERRRRKAFLNFKHKNSIIARECKAAAERRGRREMREYRGV